MRFAGSGGDLGYRRVPQLEGEVDLNLTVEAPHPVAKGRFAGLVVLGAAVGAEVRRLHGPRLAARSASWVAYTSRKTPTCWSGKRRYLK